MVKVGERYEVEQLVPHRGRMSLLDSIMEYGEDWLRARVTPRPTSPFATPDCFELGVPLDVHVKIAMRDTEDFAAYDCRIEAGGRPVAECTLKAYRPRDLGPVLAEAARG
jgi:predicted hotdog family 3-hydroxylacyl-ACP dehydratase